MKKIILILLLGILAFSLKAQDREVSRTVIKGATFYEYNGVSEDTIGTGNTQLAWDIKWNLNAPLLYNIEVKFDPDDAIDGTYQKDVVLQGKVHENDSWSDIEEKADEDFTATSVTLDYNQDLSAIIDTTATTAAPFYRYFRILIRDGSTVSGLEAGETTSLDYIHWKVYER
jgi:hypothetical protein